MTELHIDARDDGGLVDTRRRHERVIARGQVRALLDHDTDEYVLEILEISPAGLRLRTPEALYASKMELVASIHGFSQAMSLSTYVRWQEEDDQGYTLFGVEIDDSDDSDLDTWCEFQREEWFRSKGTPT